VCQNCASKKVGADRRAPLTPISKPSEFKSESFHLLANLSSNCAHRFRARSINTQKVIMLARQRMSFDPETVSLLRKTLDDAWDQLGPEQRAMTSRTLLAERILKSAAKGERDPKRLHDAALTANAA
jgi:hypothetical protein